MKNRDNPIRSRAVSTLLAALGLFLILSGFDLDKAIIPKDEIMAGGPPKDGIPALLEPKFVPADKALFLGPEEEVIGLVVEGRARAYPLKILVWHEAVNDEVGGRPLLVSY